MERCERVRDLNPGGEKRPKPVEHQGLNITRWNAHPFLGLRAISSQKRRALFVAWVGALEAGESQRPDLDPVVMSLEAKLRRAGKGKRLVIENGAEAEVNENLAAMITEAFAIRNQLLSGSDDSIEAMSGRLGMNKCRLTSLIRLSYLAPDIVRALLEGRQPIGLTPTRLLRLSKDLPHDWSEQRHVLGFAA